MRAVLLAGGLGTRFAEETDVRPKPMIEIGGKPILWHIMKIYSSHGINDFIICLGYKGYVIKEYFSNYFLHQSNVTFDLRENRMEVLEKHAEPWRVTLIDTGEETMIGGRIKRILPYIGDDDAFCLTYGDGVADINITESIAFHRREGRLATVTGTQPPGRFGAINHQGPRVTGFQEKPRGDGNWINGGFFVLSPKVGDYIKGDATVWEKEPMEDLAKEGQLSVFLHDGFWHPMDTLRDKRYLEDLWSSNKAPWKKW
ncbi:glucose-1-phosphate cytidylyltransferase [Bradyrhizobium sp. CB3481]|uniref:glucose-1-phosphate cytidylyltransferase n=1 Tax=Bradyrhizobium sp. CB3481 TaxID=3039158 RepID=UPI0024B1EDD0|nr:glucose-1-phosphate cytidylyltransferase [Bradyrhizobium sp. CB3481]WFU18752.1 glucose-1-phosphate cytidylyltransferase [Bradyrhizobium sp. CB3481]